MISDLSGHMHLSSSTLFFMQRPSDLQVKQGRPFFRNIAETLSVIENVELDPPFTVR